MIPFMLGVLGGVAFTVAFGYAAFVWYSKDVWR